ncbi:bifunctional nuclease family protein [Halorhodospira abdelmalekii]|uniref:bifunctional nuclease family protein n=1 Tax=Halorhodospira abdelmalekii TaxID=421629 RepID=UPI003084656B
MGFMGFAGLAHATERELIGEREAMLEAEVTTLAVSEQAGPVPVVLLRELESERIVPIFIGENEARAIHSALHGLRPPRPMTHDLLAALIESTESELQAVIIDGLLDSAFIAVLELRVVGREALVYVDSRASDAIALALRTEASIYVSPEVMERATEFEEFERIEEPPRLERHEI